jgi:predicted small secreted protein
MKKLAALSVIVCVAAVLSAGCTTTAKGPADAELIAKRIKDGVAAIKAKNFDAFMGMVSPSFASDAVGNRDDLLAYLKNANDAGFLNGIEIDLSEAKTTVAGDKATVAPVVASGGFGSLTLHFEGAKEKGVWVVSNVEPGY